MREFFEDDTGRLSFMRLCSLIALGVAIIMSWVAISAGTEAASFNIILTWVVAAFAPKSISKFAERLGGGIISPPKK